LPTPFAAQGNAELAELLRRCCFAGQIYRESAVEGRLTLKFLCSTQIAGRFPGYVEQWPDLAAFRAVIPSYATTGGRRIYRDDPVPGGHKHRH
jgi:hypothetical protein